MTQTKASVKKHNNTINACALMLCMKPEQLQEMIDSQMSISVCIHEKRQIADMYKSLYEQNERLEEKYKRLSGVAEEMAEAMKQSKDYLCHVVLKNYDQIQ
jgi:hypothetical protein